MIIFKVNLKERVLKAGSIVCRKNHNWFKRILAKLRKKELPYNEFELIEKDLSWLYSGQAKQCEKIAVPKRAYSTKEIKKLEAMLQLDDWCPTATDEKDIIAAVNAIRPNTFKESLTEVLTSKFYTIEPG